MKCHEFETIIDADPNTPDSDVRAHAASCAACAAYRQEMQAMDRLICKALSVTISTRDARDAQDAQDAWSAAQPATVAPKKRVSMIRWQIAASLVASVMLVGSIWIASTRDSLAEQIASHLEHESFALVMTHERVDPSTVNRILRTSGIALRTNAADVSFAATCRVRGHEVPHLVVQTEQGPITVLVLTQEAPTDTSRRFEENGYTGMIVPAPRGVLAVLGKDVPVEEAAEKLLREIVWID